VVALGLVVVVLEGLSSVLVDGHWWDGYQVMFWYEDEISGIFGLLACCCGVCMEVFLLVLLSFS